MSRPQIEHRTGGGRRIRGDTGVLLNFRHRSRRESRRRRGVREVKGASGTGRRCFHRPRTRAAGSAPKVSAFPQSAGPWAVWWDRRSLSRQIGRLHPSSKLGGRPVGSPVGGVRSAGLSSAAPDSAQRVSAVPPRADFRLRNPRTFGSPRALALPAAAP